MATTNSYHLQRLASAADDAAVSDPGDGGACNTGNTRRSNPGDGERYEKEGDALGTHVDGESGLVHVRHAAVALGAPRCDHVGPEELRTVNDDAQNPAARHAHLSLIHI